MASSTALDAVMNQAEDAAANAPAPEAAVPATVAQGSNAVAGAAIGRPSLDDMADNAGMTVDFYLTFKEDGIKIDDGKLFESFLATLDISEVVPIYSVRANSRGKTTFIKSYDGVMTSQGENFAQATARLQATNEKVDGPYQTAELPFTLLEDVPGASKGQRVGITPAITGVKFWTAFYKSLRDQGLTKLGTGPLTVRVKHKFMKNNNNNKWGVAEFELVSAE